MDKNENTPIILKFPNGEIPLPFDRTSVYTYLGATAMSHLWIEESKKGENRTGHRLFYDQFGSNDEARQRNFTKILQGMLTYGYEMHLNIKNAHSMDIDAYVEYQMREIDTEE